MRIKRRWYEQNPLTNEAMLAWQNFPEELQKALAKRMIAIIETQKIPQSGSNSNPPDSFVCITTLKNTKFKPKDLNPYFHNRWFDRHELLRKAVFSLSLAPHPVRLRLSEGIIELETYFNLPGVQNSDWYLAHNFDPIMDRVLPVSAYDKYSAIYESAKSGPPKAIPTV